MIIFTTLAEKDYFYGVSALINSILKHNIYGDKLIVGYRGDLPNWLPKFSDSKNGISFNLNDKFEVEFVEVQGDLHMVHEKPKWFYHLTENLEPEADEYFFFDSDIIITNRMSFFGEWVKQGVALCEDINYDMSLTHPIRKQWVKMAEIKGLAINNNLSRYVNSGFLGWTKETKKFVKDWDDCFNILKEKSGDLKQFREVNDRTLVVFSANQDALNLAAMTTTCPISIIGPEGMGFHYGLNLMQHPLGPKPWSRSFIMDFFYGKPPRIADLVFWQYVNGLELKPFSTFTVKRKIFIVKFLKFLGRFYSQR